MKNVVWYCGGGSGGHIQPLYSVFKKNSGSGGIFFVADKDFDHHFCKLRGLDYVPLAMNKGVNDSPVSFLFKMIISFFQVLRVFWQSRPQKVLSSGGYAAFIPCLFAIFSGTELYLIEPNRVCGKVNRIFCRFARKVFTAYPQVEGLVGSNSLMTGLPVAWDEPVQKEPRFFLLYGASLGAQSLNRFCLSWLKKYDFNPPVPVIWVTGISEYDLYKTCQKEGEIQIHPFLENLNVYLEEALLVMSRAGAGTIADLKWFRVPAVLIPFPNHQDRQQYKNAQELIDLGSALLVEDENLGVFLEEDTLSAILQDKKKLFTMRMGYAQKTDFSASERIVEVMKDGICSEETCES